ncbi:MAG: YqeG family HAD IIIA-type phosphatase [Sporolactobacillus sp.]
MLKLFLPEEHVDSILDIKPEMLKSRGIRGLITDLDNTLVAWDVASITPELVAWFASLQQAGIATMILTNNSERRVKAFTGTAKIPYVFRAKKPLSVGFKRAMHLMNLQRDELVVVGDQIMTDIWGGNRIGAHTILVVPISANDGWATRLNRLVERFILSRMRRRGWLKWED